MQAHLNAKKPSSLKVGFALYQAIGGLRMMLVLAYSANRRGSEGTEAELSVRRAARSRPTQIRRDAEKANNVTSLSNPS